MESSPCGKQDTVQTVIWPSQLNHDIHIYSLCFCCCCCINFIGCVCYIGCFGHINGSDCIGWIGCIDLVICYSCNFYIRCTGKKYPNLPEWPKRIQNDPKGLRKTLKEPDAPKRIRKLQTSQTRKNKDQPVAKRIHNDPKGTTMTQKDPQWPKRTH